ncbi:hypothetical protein N431DRAFT_379513 [Stipitochalara longipes BDJ]|nr:hypothetical protein N431DRAFT_379513 [Stipitochalara longipes BDJ]
MFTTLRYVKDAALLPEREGHVLSHLACKACRSRKLKCTGESNGCRRCLSKAITCTYPDPSQRTRRSKGIQKRAKSKQSSQATLQLTRAITENPALDLARSHELNPALLSPWTDAPFQNWNDGSFLDGFLGNGSLSQELELLSNDMQVEGADFFPLDHYSCLNEFLRSESSTSDSTGLISSPPVSSPSFSNSRIQIPPNPSQWSNPPAPSSLPPSTSINLSSPAPSSNPPTQPQCACLPTALHLLSLITINESSIRNIPRTIHLNKHILQQSKTLFSCTTCTAVTAAQTMTILAVLCQKVVTAYEHVIAFLAKQYYVMHNESMDHVPAYLRIFDEDEVDVGEGLGGDGDEMQFQIRDYEVEKFEEPCLLSGLVTLQLGILRAFLARMKGVPEHFARDYVGLLDEVDKRVMKLGRFCSTSCEV